MFWLQTRKAQMSKIVWWLIALVLAVFLIYALYRAKKFLV